MSPKGISNRRYSNTVFLPTPASPDSPISYAKLNVLMLSQKHVKQKIFKYIIHEHSWKPRFVRKFYVQNRVFWCFPEGVLNRIYSIMFFLSAPESLDSPILCAKVGVLMPSQRHFKQRYIYIYYCCTPLKGKILQFYLQNSVFRGFPKAFQIEDIQIYCSAPDRLDSSILCAELGVLMLSQRHFK